MATNTRKKTAKKTEAEAPEIASVAADEKAVQTEKTYTKDEVQDMIAAAVAQALAQDRAARPAAAPARERVQLLWMAPVSNDNVQEFGPNGRFGRITGPSGSLYVPKDEFPQILDGLTRLFLDRRWLIVVSGLDEEEREAFGVNYREGEYLTRQAFDNLLKQGEKLLNIYPALCAGSKGIVAKRVYEGWQARNKAVNRGLVKGLAKLCKRDDPNKETFRQIMAEMNAAETDEDEDE